MASKKATAPARGRKQNTLEEREEEGLGATVLRAAESLERLGKAPEELRGMKLLGRELQGLPSDLKDLRSLGAHFRARYLDEADPTALAASHILLALYALMVDGGGKDLDRMHVIARSVLRPVAEIDAEMLIPVETTRGRLAADSLAGQFDALVPMIEVMVRDVGRAGLALTSGALGVVVRAYEIVPGLLDGLDLAPELLVGQANFLADRAKVEVLSNEPRRAAEKLCEMLLRRMLDHANISATEVRRRMQFRAERAKKAGRSRE